jgi:hypothetical protein
MYLNVDDPVCAWATYRGLVVSANVVSNDPGVLSVWLTRMLRRNGGLFMTRECDLEQIRRAHYPEKVSRWWGIYTFPDADSAVRARTWGERHITTENHVEINLSEAQNASTHDSNWISSHGDHPDRNWMLSYWKGDPCPSDEPIWETLVDGRIVVLGTDVRECAYKLIRATFPESLCFLELARIAAWIGSDLGSVAAFARSTGELFKVDYFLNMVDAKNPAFLDKLGDYMRAGENIDHAAIRPFVEQGGFGRTPDLSRFSLIMAKSEVPFLSRLIKDRTVNK